MTLGERRAETAEVQLLLRWAASELTPREREAVRAFLLDLSLQEACATRQVSRQAIFMNRSTAFRKMRGRLAMLGILGSRDVLQE